MRDNKSTNDAAFVRRVLLYSVFLLLCAVLAVLLIVSNLNQAKVFCVNALTSINLFESAIEIASGIDDEPMSLNCRYELGEKLSSKGRYEQAAELYSSLAGYRNSEELLLENLYFHADKLYSSGEFETALEVFQGLGNHEDAADKVSSCSYAMAEKFLEDGDYLRAISAFIVLGEYSDAQQRAYDAALVYCGDAGRAKMIVNSGGLSPESVEKAAFITEKRSTLPLGSLAAGSYHTLFLRTDATVAACGDNSKGQCNVGSWEDIIQVCAGAEHSLALRRDGTVLAVGSNEYGQCDVGSWKNVVSVAAGDNDSLALLADGSVLYCGSHDYENISSADDIKKIFAGSYGAAAISSQGRLLSSHKTVTAENPQLLLELIIGTGSSAALYADGRCIADFLPDEAWQDIITACRGANAFVAVDINGQVKSHFFRSSDALDFSTLPDVQLCAAGTEHYVFLCSDGGLRAFGDNSFGQCNVDTLSSDANQ